MKRALFGLLCFFVGLLVGFGTMWPRYQAAVNTARSLEVSGETLEASQAALQNKYEELDANYDELQSQYAQLQATHQSLIEDYERAEQELQEANRQLSQTKAQVTKLRKEIKGLEEELAGLKANYKNLLREIKRSTLKDPTWEELRQFLEADDTETLVYLPDEFDCVGFALTLRDRTWRRGFRCAFVEVEFEGTEYGNAHALTAFNTPDRGLIYVDDTGNSDGTGVDGIAYVEVGKPYGLISLKGVKEEYIDPYTRPEEFWKPLRRVRYAGNLFGYDYYTNWRQRVEFYRESIAAYNKAVAEYNRGSTRYSYSQLDSWSRNLDELEKDLGPIYEPLGVVKNIELYWN